MTHDLRRIYDRIASCLFDGVLPFWLRHGKDPAGGINTCMAEDGALVSRDKWLWSQWRAVWVLSRLFRRTGDLSLIEWATEIVHFCCAHGWTDNGWRLCVAGDGTPLRAAESIYVDAFAIYGLAEYLRATDDREAQPWLDRTVLHVSNLLNEPHDLIPHFPYPVPAGMRVHGIPMILGYSLYSARSQVRCMDVEPIVSKLCDEIFDCFYRADRDVVLERVRNDGTEAPAPLGTAVVPGHVIESMWFQIEIAHSRGDIARVEQSARLILRHLDIGWDDEFGGIRLAVDANGAEEVGWAFADYKLWWPHTEAMVATLLAFEHTNDRRHLDWYDRVEKYAFEHFARDETGEWVQRLRRNGEPTTEVVALPVKDPFHLPRALLLCLESLERMTGVQAGGVWEGQAL